uniref:Uncharacterized protein n=1 Tax=Anguilla anguilla TaxID=7936 RepID=A0A0E9XQF1_ANGAN
MECGLLFSPERFQHHCRSSLQQLL